MTMSKSNDISNIATLDDHRPLADSELDAVSGGWLPTGIPGYSVPPPSRHAPGRDKMSVDIQLKSE
jgi:hypothetical protein